MEQNMKGIINVVRNMVMVNLYLQMDLIIKVIQLFQFDKENFFKMKFKDMVHING